MFWQKRQRDLLLLVRQYRPAVGAETLELPSGHVEDGELPEAAARRELAEETGYGAEKFELLGTLAPDTGRLGNKLWCFYADNATRLRSHVTREEGIQSVQCEPRELIRYVREGEINHGLHLAVLLLAAMKGRMSIGQSRRAPWMMAWRSREITFAAAHRRDLFFENDDMSASLPSPSRA